MGSNFYKQLAGQKGEDIAVRYLKKHGYTILERNFRIRGGEIDIIGIDPSTGSHSASSGQAEVTLVFVEVKTRSSTEFGTPFEAITPWKLKSLIKAAQFYRLKHPRLPELMRIDAVGIVLDSEGNPASIELVKNIS